MRWYQSCSLLGVAAIAQAAKLHYSLDLTWGTGSPNGVSREMIFVNGQFPGPAIILDEGDEAIVSLWPYCSIATSILIW